MLGTKVDKQRLAVAADIGATQTLNIDEADPLELVRSLGDGYGADLVVDCSGVSIALQVCDGAGPPQWHHHENRLGTAAASTSTWIRLCRKAVTLQGCFSHLYSTWERALAHYSPADKST